MNYRILKSDWPELQDADPLADSVVEDWSRANQTGKALLLHGMKWGSKAMTEAPTSYRLFLEKAETVLACAPDLSLATQAYLLARPVWISIGLGPGALIHTYSDPAIAKTLACTGSLLEAATARRLAETQLWNLQLLRDGAWTIGGTGYVHTLQVRLLHARMRTTLKGEKFLGKLANVSMNQQRMVRTWLGFAAVGPLALERLGIDWTKEEKMQVARLWQLVGRLLGIPDRLMDSLSEPQAMQSWLACLDQHAGPPVEETLQLTRSMLDALSVRMSAVLKLPIQVSHGLMHAVARHIHGDSMADLVGVLPSDVSSLVQVYVDANRYRIQQIRSNDRIKHEHLHEAKTEIEAIIASFPGATAYQHS